VTFWLRIDSGWEVDRYNGTFAIVVRTAIANRLGTILGTVGGQQLSNWREILKFLSNFDTVRWPRG
jgi:hypothetical protein